MRRISKVQEWQVILVLSLGLANIRCGGGASSSSTTTTPADFGLTLSPSTVAAEGGGVTVPVSVMITPQHGFSGPVTVEVQQLPADVTAAPASSFQVAAGSTRIFNLNVGASAVPGSSSVTLQATSGALLHVTSLTLTVDPPPVVKTYDSGTDLYLETDTPTEMARIGLRKAWGGSITEGSLNGINYVNSDDPGRQIQTSLWDGDADYTTSWGYNPIEAGDTLFEGSPLISFTLLPDSIYTKTQPIQWAPFNFAPISPVLGDAYIEKWINRVPGYNRVFKVHYKITHFGTDLHTEHGQEAPVAYVNPNVPTFRYYKGTSPWTNAPLTSYNIQGPCCTLVHTPELWGAYIDDHNIGLALYTPGQYPDSQIYNASVTLQLTPQCPFTWYPGAVLEFDTYILLGPIDESRAAIYALHSQQTERSPLPPFGFGESPAPGATVAGTVDVGGWAWSLASPQMNSVDVLVDGLQVGAATYGLSRPDVISVNPEAPPNTGFEYTLDTTQLTNGKHSILVRFIDVNGRISIFPTIMVTVSN